MVELATKTMYSIATLKYLFHDGCYIVSAQLMGYHCHSREVVQYFLLKQIQLQIHCFPETPKHIHGKKMGTDKTDFY